MSVVASDDTSTALDAGNRSASEVAELSETLTLTYHGFFVL